MHLRLSKKLETGEMPLPYTLASSALGIRVASNSGQVYGLPYGYD